MVVVAAYPAPLPARAHTCSMLKQSLSEGKLSVPERFSYRWALNSLFPAALLFAACSSNTAGPPATHPSPSSPPNVTFVEYRLASAASQPDLITQGPDGAMWFAESRANAIGRIPAGTANPKIVEFPLPTASSEPIGITVGADGALWFTEHTANRIGRIPTSATVANPDVTEFPAAPSQGAIGLAAGPDHNLWFGTYAGTVVARMTLAGKVAASFSTTQQHTDNFATGPDGAMWFAECEAPGYVGRVTMNGKLSEALVPATLGAKTEPLAIAAGSDGNMWFTDFGTHAIGKAIVTGSGIGAITEIAVPSVGAPLIPQGIAAGPDGALWFTASTPSGAAYAGRIPTNATAGSDITLYRLATTSKLMYGIAMGSGNTMWITEYSSGKIGRLTIQR
jgi:virginiamycin B lyase